MKNNETPARNSEKKTERTGFRLADIIENDKALTVLSILIAVIVWAVVSINQFPTVQKKYANVPVVVDLEGTYAQTLGLDVISISDETVTVVLEGDRATMGELGLENLRAEADIQGVVRSGTVALNLTVVADNGATFTAKSVEPSSVTVDFDQIVTKEFAVKALSGDLKLKKGYLSGDPTVYPETIKVTGAQSNMDRITDVAVMVSADQEIDKTYEYTTSDIVLYNNNAIVPNDGDSFTFDNDQFRVVVPVYQRKTLPLDVNITNAPEGFDVEYFRKQLVFSADRIDVASQDEKISQLTSLTIGTINMREVDAGAVFEFETGTFLPEGFDDLSGIEKVTVTCPSENISKKPISIGGSEIVFLNNNTDFSISTITSGLTLYVVGDADQIEQINKGDISAQVDLSSVELVAGVNRVSVDLKISTYDKVWFNGVEGVANPKIYVQAESYETNIDEVAAVE
ncbi:MAG: hypothetical protein IJ251_07680 [Oscillospiraceae bacterium]|nr:hypothetical protein [Oscillospiraceae bacterium]